jgi:ATP-dependent Clp protease ATP-binding subunit ClpC
VNFTNTIIIATSNIGSDVIQENLRRVEMNRKSYQELKNELMRVLRSHFRPEFLNRIDEIIVFHALSQAQVKDIAKLQLERVKRTARGQGVELIFDDSLLDYLSDVGYLPEFGARELRRRIQTDVETVLAREMLKEDIKEGDHVKLSYRDGEVKIEKLIDREKKPKNERDEFATRGSDKGGAKDR